MNDAPHYYVLDKSVIHEKKIRRSRFIAHLQYCRNMESAKEYIHEISRLHKTANHNCWAYIIGDKAENEHSSDAGEPSGTAGKPMLNALKKYNLTNTTAVVTRYFGGVKLGVRGLIDAYGQIVEEAINEITLKELVILQYFRITSGYDFIEKLKYDLSELDAEITAIEYAKEIELCLSISDDKAPYLENYLSQEQAKNKITYQYIQL
jgi:uncharacterized YigZ family protein